MEGVRQAPLGIDIPGGVGGLKQRSPPWWEWIFSGPARHRGAAYIKPSHKLSPVGRRR